MKTFRLHTIDAVNQAHIERLAAHQDYTAFTWAERAEFVQRYSHMTPKQVLGVFSDNLEDEDVRKLRASGVMVFPRMDEEAMKAFVAAMAPAEPNRERSDDPTRDSG